MGMFIQVEVDPKVVAKTEGLAAKLVEVCPVNIFKLAEDPEAAASGSSSRRLHDVTPFFTPSGQDP